MSIWKALQHRTSAINEATALTDTIITRALALKQPIILTHTIKSLSTEVLSNFDPTAAAVYTASN